MFLYFAIPTTHLLHYLYLSAPNSSTYITTLQKIEHRSLKDSPTSVLEREHSSDQNNHPFLNHCLSSFTGNRNPTIGQISGMLKLLHKFLKNASQLFEIGNVADEDLIAYQRRETFLSSTPLLYIFFQIYDVEIGD